MVEVRQFPERLAPPKHLQAAGKALWRTLVEEYHIRDGAGLALVRVAAECRDRLDEAQQCISEHGAITKDRYGNPRQNPACLLERDARTGLFQALKQLNLDLEPLRDRGRPPGPSIRA
jgi:phage terminase small subunit